MNKKNGKALLLLGIVLIIIFIIIIKIVNKPSYKSNYTNDVDIYNDLLRNAKSISDKKNCSQIKDIEIKSVCEGSIKAKFNDMSKIENFDDCSKLSGTKESSKELRSDICRYNKMKKIVTIDNYKSLCDKFQTTDMKSMCIKEYSTKFKK